MKTFFVQVADGPPCAVTASSAANAVFMVLKRDQKAIGDDNLHFDDKMWTIKVQKLLEVK